MHGWRAAHEGLLCDDIRDGDVEDEAHPDELLEAAIRHRGGEEAAHRSPLQPVGGEGGKGVPEMG
jgi:hypothetical protein